MWSLYLLIAIIAVGIWFSWGVIFGPVGQVIKDKFKEMFVEDDK